MENLQVQLNQIIIQKDIPATYCQQDFILCYEKQYFNIVVFLEKGSAILSSKRKKTKTLKAPCWLGLEEMSNNKASPYTVTLKKGSLVRLINKANVLEAS